MEIQIPGRRRRTHTESFKLAVTHACQVPGASVAGGALGHGGATPPAYSTVCLDLAGLVVCGLRH